MELARWLAGFINNCTDNVASSDLIHLDQTNESNWLARQWVKVCENILGKIHRSLVQTMQNTSARISLLNTADNISLRDDSYVSQEN